MSNGKTIHPDSDAIIKSGVDNGIQKALNEIVLHNEKYLILKLLATSGESEVCLVEKGGQRFVLKLYYPKFKPKKEILDNLKGLKHADIITLIDYGYYEKNRFYELDEYAEGGSLFESIPIRDTNKLKQIVQEVVNAFN